MNDKYDPAQLTRRELSQLLTRIDESAIVIRQLRSDNARLKRMLDWALKPETQAKLQADFDEHDRMIANTGNA